jgi:hypothetical protein
MPLTTLVLAVCPTTVPDMPLGAREHDARTDVIKLAEILDSSAVCGTHK